MRYIKRKGLGFFLFFNFSCTCLSFLGILFDIICFVDQTNRTGNGKAHAKDPLKHFYVHNNQIKAIQIVDRLNFLQIKFDNIFFFPVRIFTKSESVTHLQRWVVVIHIY